MGQMLPMNDGVAYLAQITNETKTTDIIIVSDDSQPRNKLHALDFGVQNGSQRNTFMIVAATEAHDGANSSSSNLLNQYPLHKVGMSLPMIVTKNTHKSRVFKCHIITSNLSTFTVGGWSCNSCHRLSKENHVPIFGSAEDAPLRRSPQVRRVRSATSRKSKGRLPRRAAASKRHRAKYAGSSDRAL